MTARRATALVGGLCALARWPLAAVLQSITDRRIRRRAEAEVALRDAGGCVDLIAPYTPESRQA